MPYGCGRIRTTQGAFSLLVYEKFEPLADQNLIPRWCENHFEIEMSVFANYRFWHRTRGKAIWVTPSSFLGTVHPDVAAMGMLVMRKPPPQGKPTSVFLQRFGVHAQRNVYELSAAEALRFLNREALTVEPRDDARGYAVVKTADYVVGCGRIVGDQLHSEIPKHWLAEL